MSKRDSKGRFKKGHRRGARGFGTIITMRRGMGALPGGAMGEAIIAPAVGGLTVALVVLAIRHMVDASLGSTQRMLVRNAPLFGGLAGTVVSLALMMLGGSTAAIAGFVSSLGVTAAMLGQDLVFRSSTLAVTNMAAITSGAPAGAAGIRRLGGGRRGTGAIVPEYSRRGMGAMVMEPVGPSGRRAGTLGRPSDYGETVTLSGLNTSAFGTPGFRA